MAFTTFGRTRSLLPGLESIGWISTGLGEMAKGRILLRLIQLLSRDARIDANWPMAEIVSLLVARSTVLRLGFGGPRVVNHVRLGRRGLFP